MESVNKSFGVDKVFADVEKSFEEYNSVSSGKGNIFEKGEACEAKSAKVVSGLTDILKNVLSKPEYEEPEKIEITNRFCEFVDEISNSSSLWGFARLVNDGEVLISFLKELATKGCVSQIDKIFRSGGGNYPLVNWISCNYEDKFNELFQKLPGWYQNKLLGETMSYEEGDKTYTCSLISGPTLMDF